MRDIDFIIQEQINELTRSGYNKELISEGIRDFLKQVLDSYFRKAKETSSDSKDRKSKDKKKSKLIDKLKDKFKTPKRKKYKFRKTKNGGGYYYDYDDYLIKHKKLSKGDADNIKGSIDMDNTDIAAVARIVYPNHTDEGGQSQLRKVLTGERPMPKDIAEKLSNLISQGRVAVKR